MPIQMPTLWPQAQTDSQPAGPTRTCRHRGLSDGAVIPQPGGLSSAASRCPKSLDVGTFKQHNGLRPLPTHTGPSGPTLTVRTLTPANRRCHVAGK